MKIREGDKVKILSGKDRGKTGTVDKVFTKTGRALVSGLNLFKKHVKPQSRQDQKSGGIISFSRPLLIGCLAIICPKCGKPAKIGFSQAGKEKFRICKRCKEKI